MADSGEKTGKAPASFPGIDDFLRFYRTTALEITADIEYEKDFTSTLHSSSAVIERFKPQKYAGKISKYLDEQGVYKRSPYDGEVMQLLLILLAPPVSSEVQLNREVRIFLFNSVLKSVAAQTTSNLPVLLRGIYDKVRFGSDNLHGIGKDEIMDLLRGSAAQFDVELKTAKVNTDAAERAQMDPRNRNLPRDILGAAGLRAKKDLKRVFGRFSAPEFWFTSLIEMVLLIAVFWWKEFLIVQIGVNLSEAADMAGIMVNSLAVLLVLHIFIRTVRFSATASRKKLLRQLLTGLEKKKYFTRSESETEIRRITEGEKTFL